MRIIREPGMRPDPKPGDIILATVRDGKCVELIVFNLREKKAIERIAARGDESFRLVDVTGPRNFDLPPVDVGTEWPF